MKQFYTLYSRPRGTKRWTRESQNAYTRYTAIIVFQDRLINNVLSGSSTELRLRPVPKHKFGA